MSAFGSGMAIVFEISGEYIERIVRKKFNRLERICFAEDILKQRRDS